ncbi:MAG: response regulator [Blastochloris sp.]|nr:response regulator [Blastochloris sp.]
MSQVHPPLVLLIDDDPQFRYLLQRYTQSSNLRFNAAGFDSRAGEAIISDPPALILLNLTSSALHRLTAIHALQAQLSRRDIPLILCSTFEQNETFREFAVDHWLWKPVMYDDFRAALAQVGLV